MEGAWSCYRSGHFNEGREWSFYINRKFNRWRMVMLRRWAVLRRENGHVTEVVSLMEKEWSFYGSGQFNGREWSCYRGGQFNGGRIIMLQRCPL